MTECANVNVYFTNKSIKSFNVESRQTVINFKKTVANSLNIEDDRFFGFYFQDDQKNIYWLSDDKMVFQYEFLKSNCQTKLNFAFKYFYHFDYWIADNMTRNLFYHQLKQQLYDGEIECDSDRCFKLLAMTLLLDDQLFKSPQDIQKMNIISAHLFVKHPSIDYCIDQIMIKYNELGTISKEELMKKFIIQILELPFQLTHFFLAKNFHSLTITLSINDFGIFESDKCNKSAIKSRYGWSEIANISHHKTRVNIDIQDSSQRSSSIRRKSGALTISYDLTNCNLAKSFVFLAKDIVNFMSQSVASIRVMNTPRRNLNNLKKSGYNNTYSGKQEKIRASAQNSFISENDVTLSRSSSRISLTSSYGGSAITNDSASLITMDEELLNIPVNVPEKQKIFETLNEKRKCIVNSLNKNIKEAVQNCILEENLTKVMPADLEILDPKKQIKLTKFSLRTPLGVGEMSSFQCKKNGILEEIETLQNIVAKLKENEKKHKSEIKKKEGEINNCMNKIKLLEEENANQLHIMNTSRSNSVGCLYLFSNGNVPVSNGHSSSSDIVDAVAPMTEPRSRKNQNLYTDRSSSTSDTHQPFNSRYPRMKGSEENDIDNVTSSMSTLRRPSDIKNYSQFQRFTSTRNQIKGLPQKLQITFHQKKYPTDDISNSNSMSSVDSNNAVDPTDAICDRSSISNTDSETSEELVVPMRKFPKINNGSNNYVRDSREINQHRAKISYKARSHCKTATNYNNNNNHNRNSVSLEELREDISEMSESTKSYATKYRRETIESVNSTSKLTYHMSKRDIKPIHLTRGKQPSIIRKAARSINSED